MNFSTTENKFAFTLAETLITLVIVGVVAALTIPNMIAKYHAQQYSAKLNKAFATVGELVARMNLSEAKLTTSDNYPAYTLFNVMKRHVSNLKTGSVLGYSSVLNTYKNFSGTSKINNAWFDEGMFVLNDGTTMFLQNFTGSNVMISVDINGHLKKPNQLGRDLFMFEVLPNGNVVPMGVDSSTYPENSKYCSLSSNNNLNGAGCTALALKDKEYFNKYR